MFKKLLAHLQISVNQASQITTDLNKLKRMTIVILAIILISVIMLITHFPHNYFFQLDN